MKIIEQPEGAAEAADSSTFVGSATVRRLAGLTDDESVKGFWVSFEAGGRTNWHRHTGVQLLLIVSGEGLVQTDGELARRVRAGDTVSIPANEKHWHGAAPETAMAHVAINLNATTEWLEPVGEGVYQGRAGRA